MPSIRLDTPRNLYANGHRIAAYCPSCERWQELSTITLARLGALDRDVTKLRVRCRDCGSTGGIQVRPPCPKAGPVHTMGY